MRVAIVSEAPLTNVNGVSVFIENILSHSEASIQFLILTPKPSSRYRELPVNQNYRLIEYDGFSLPTYPELTISVPVTSLTRDLAEFEPDVIHIFDPYILGLIAIRFSTMRGINCVVSYMTNAHLFLLSRKVPDFIANAVFGFIVQTLKKAHTVIVPSLSAYELLEPKEIKRLEILPFGIDSEKYCPSKRNEQLRSNLLQNGRFKKILLFVGRLAKEKNISALHDLASCLPGIRLVIVGDGPEMKALKRYFSDTPTLFTGYLINEKLAEMFASADLFVYPSLSETFGHVILQALSSGLPVVAYDASGVRDQINESLGGVLCEINTSQCLLYTVSNLVFDSLRIRELGRNGRTYAQTYNWGSIARTLLEVYHSAKK